MPRLSINPPRLCRHKATGRAVVYVDGKAHYLGRHGSAESLAAYRQFLAEWSGRQGPATPSMPASRPRPRRSPRPSSSSGGRPAILPVP